MTRIMALDIGSKRIGVALTDPLRITSQPYTTIEFRSHREAIARIAEICDQMEVSEVIAGLPVNTAGQATERTRLTEKFIVKIEKALGATIVRVDERFSSAEAEAHMRNLGKKPSRNKADIDKIAAALILKATWKKQHK